MSSRKSSKISLSPKARQDFIDILRYTGENWGLSQLRAYQVKIDQALKAIAENPEIGQHRFDLPTTHFAYLVGSHIIVYRQRAGDVAVVRILHQRMALGRKI